MTLAVSGRLEDSGKEAAMLRRRVIVVNSEAKPARQSRNRNDMKKLVASSPPSSAGFSARGESLLAATACLLGSTRRTAVVTVHVQGFLKDW